ncbi:atrial natriuretic peptide receptor 2-like [Haliotis cracherodii]|uniref:atrial natriuretic peptide receptor 2-like n=1 Tax=Haliotis cracherodii TaxID=6455 RepID=UPI0039EA4943
MSRRLNGAILHLFILTLSPFCEGVVQLRGAGASFPEQVYKSWTQSYKVFRQQQSRDINATYLSIGSGSGRKRIIKNDGTLEFAGSDSIMSETEKKQAPDLVMFPTLAGGTVVGYNLPECTSTLNLTREHVVGIFNGTFTSWNDSSIAEKNPFCNLPSEKIRVVVRADKSGTTSMFTAALSRFSKEWNQTFGVFDLGFNKKTNQPDKWNNSVITTFGEKSVGVSGLLLSIKYTIGYVSVAGASEHGITYATLQNRKGHYVRSTTTAIQGAMDRWSQNAGDELTGTLSDQDHEDAYPIAGFTYMIVFATEMSDCDSAKELVRYVNWFMHDQKAKDVCTSVHLVPLSQVLVEKNVARILKIMTCKGQSVWDIVQADIAEENRVEQTWIVPVAVSVPLVLLLVSVLLGYIAFQRWKLNKMIENDEWDIPIEDIIFYLDDKVLSGGRSKLGTMKSIKSLQNIEDIPEGSELLDQILQWPGKWKGHVIGIRLLEIKEMANINREMKRLLLWIRDSIVHSNVVRFFGLTNLDDDKYVIGEYCGKGPMTDILQDEKYNLTNDFKFSLSSDIASGMNFLHNHGIIHGSLNSSCCLIDSRWTVKVGDWEYCKLFKQLYKKKNPLHYIRKDPHYLSKYAAAFRDFWVAPEILRTDFELSPSTQTDVYSFSIIIQEIFTREDPYSEHADALSPDEVLKAVVNNNLRPQPNDDTPLNVRQIMEIAWSDNAATRPTFEQILKMLRQSRSSRKSVLDSMMEAMEEYTAHLEERVEERTSELTVAKRNMETMMNDIIPNHLVKRITNGQSVETKVYLSLGIIMADIINIKYVTENASAKDIVQYLNDIHSEIETALQKKDTYRTNLQGDSFAVVVGLQEAKSTTEKCVETVANIALDIISHANKATCPSSISKPFEFRLGAHIGSVATGIVGQAAPKFVIMGEPIDVTKSLLSQSTSSNVRISTIMYKHICKKTYFFVEPAEPIEHKGIKMDSYWLKGRDCLVDIPSDISVDSGVDTEKSRCESRASKSSDKSRGSIKSNNGSASAIEDDKEANLHIIPSESISSWGLNPLVTVKPPKGKQSKNKIYPIEQV